MEENSIFIRTFGDYPLIRIMDFLIYSRDFDYPITEIASNSHINFQTLKKLWPKLEQDGIVVSTRIMAGTTLYRIDTHNPVVKRLIELNNFLCWEYAEKVEKEQEVAVWVNKENSWKWAILRASSVVLRSFSRFATGIFVSKKSWFIEKHFPSTTFK